ncbi:MAG: glutathione S-transferase family protein [Proteobacteria bacterium]|nr:glutathione S-transferase family protein [Pseudomonadota bacterium]
MTEAIKVFSYRRCPFAMRVRIALHEKEIPFEIKEEDLKNFSEELRRLHPEVKVPLLVHGKRIIYESAIITEYIDELMPDKNPLMPKTAGEKSEVRLWTYWCNHQFKPDLDRFKYGTSRFKEEECLGAEETLRISDWLVGEFFSLADINVFPFVRQISRIQPVPAFLNQFPRTVNWMDRIGSRPSVLKTISK